MIEINAKSPFRRNHDVETWIRSLPSIDPGDAFDRIGSEVADLVPGRRRSRGWLSLALPAVALAAITVTVAATLWLLTHRAATPDSYGLEGLVPDAANFDRDAGIRAASEGMAAPDRAGAPADDADLGAL